MFFKYKISSTKLTNAKIPITPLSNKSDPNPFSFTKTTSIPIVISIRTKKVSRIGVRIKVLWFYFA